VSGLRERLFEEIERLGSEIVPMQLQLVEAKGVGPDNGGEGELDKAEVVEGWVRELGMELMRVDAPDERAKGGIRPNVIGIMPGGSGPGTWVLAHLDVVPPGEMELWDSDPWKVRVEGERIYGRGVQDNNAAIVSAFLALKAIKNLGIEPPGPARVVLVSDEETGSGYGLDYVLAKRPELFNAEQLIVVPDAGEPDGSLIEIAEKSILWLRVEVLGKQVHGSTPHKGVNALFAAARMMSVVREIAKEFGEPDPLFSPPTTTMEPTAKPAGVSNINTIPGRDVFHLDCRILPGIDLEHVMATIRERFEAIAAQEGAKVKLEAVQYLQAPEPTPKNAPVVEALKRSVQLVHGLNPRVGGVGGGTVAAFFRKRGLPAAVWCTCEHTAHMPNEYATIPAQIADAKVFALLYTGLWQ